MWCCSWYLWLGRGFGGAETQARTSLSCSLLLYGARRSPSTETCDMSAVWLGTPFGPIAGVKAISTGRALISPHGFLWPEDGRVSCAVRAPQKGSRSHHH